MENNFKGSKGEWKFKEIVNKKLRYRFFMSSDNGSVCKIPIGNDLLVEKDRANAQLIADAGNVRQQIPFDLPELLKQRNELLEMVKMLNQVNPSFSLYDEAKKLITKCEGGKS